VTDTTLEGPKNPRIIYVHAAWLKMTGYGRHEIANQTPRMLQGKHTDRAVVGSIKSKLSNREVFHGQTWNYRKNGEPFLMNWYCCAMYGERAKPIHNVAEQEDVTEMDTLRLKLRLMAGPGDAEALRFFSVLDEWKSSREGNEARR
jgi:PAS domain S-box-containing protein